MTCGAGAESVSVPREAESEAGAAPVPSGTFLRGGARGKVTFRWQFAGSARKPLQILIATERHARLRERSDEVSLDVQLWTLRSSVPNSLTMPATAWVTSVVKHN